MALAFDETPFTYLTSTMKNKNHVMHSVVNDNIANWLGYDSLVADNSNQSNF